MAQMKRTSVRPKPGKSGSGVRKMTSAPARMFRPGNPKPVVDFMRGTCRMGDENATERKDRIVGD